MLNQHTYTINEIQKNRLVLDISDEDLNFFIALLNANSIGKFMVNKANLDDTFNENINSK